MAILSRIQNSVRALIEDLTETHEGDTFTIASAASSATLTLSESNVIAISSVTKNGSSYSSDNYSLSGNELSINASVAVNDVFVVKYTYYSMYSNSEIKSYLEGTFAYLSINRVGNFVIDDAATDEISPIPTPKQERLIALVTAILIKPLESSYRTATVSITYPEKYSKEEKIRRAIADYSQNIGVFDIN